MVDINRGSSGLTLPSSVSSEILSRMTENSVVQTAARRIALPGNGSTIAVITGEPTASWVEETESKPVSNGTAQTKILRGYKLAVIETFSNEFRRDIPALYGALVDRLPAALAKKFDSTVFFGTAPGSDFDTLASATAINIASLAGTYSAFVDSVTTVNAEGFDHNGFIVSPQLESIILNTVDDIGRPLFLNNVTTEGSIGSILGRPVFKSRAAYKSTIPTVGFGGDWSQAVWGSVEDVVIKVSDQATLVDGENTINLFQQNMFAVLAEIEIGFRVGDLDAFTKITNDETP
jgi:HK97 family phage major capsid protein